MNRALSYVQHYQKGLEFYNAGHYDQALVALKKSIVLQPDFPDAYFLIARIYSELKEYEEAVSMYEKLLDLLPNDLEVRSSYAQTLIKAGQERKGVKILRKILKLNPSDMDAREELARYYIKNSKICRANSVVIRGLKLFPDEPVFFCIAGDLFRRRGKLQKAQEYYEECLDIDPEYEPAKRGLNGVIREMETPAKQRSKRTEEDEARSELVEAAGLYRAGKYDQAIIRLMELRDRPAVAREAAMLLGLSFVRKGLFKRAHDVLHSFLQENQNDLMVLYNLGLTANRMGRYHEAIDYLAQTLSIDDEYVEALIEMGIACQMSGELLEAREFLVRAVKLDRESPRPYAYLGRLAYDKDDRLKAVEFLKKAKEYDENCPDVFLILGYIAVQNGKYDEGLKHLMDCLNQMPDHFEAHKLLGKAYLQYNQPDLAAEAYRSALHLNPADPECNKMLNELTAQLSA